MAGSHRRVPGTCPSRNVRRSGRRSSGRCSVPFPSGSQRAGGASNRAGGGRRAPHSGGRRQHVAFGQQGPKVVVHRVIELFAASASADGNTGEPRSSRQRRASFAASGNPRGTDRDHTTVRRLLRRAGEFVVAPRDGGGRQPSCLRSWSSTGTAAWTPHGLKPHVVHLGQPVRGSYWDRARGSGASCRRHSPLDREGRIVADPREVRKAVARERFEQPRGIAWLCTSIAFDAGVGRAAGRLSLDSSASIQFLRVLWVDLHVGRCEHAWSHAFLLDGTSAQPYRRLPAACNTPLEWLSGRSVVTTCAVGNANNGN